MAQALFCSNQSLAQGRETLTAQIFQLPSLEQVPDAFLRIQLGGIAGQSLQMESFGCSSCEKGLDLFGPMDRGSIPNDQELAADLAQEYT